MDFPSGGISLDDEQTSGEVSFAEPGVSKAVPPEIADARALKAHIGLGSDSPGLDVLSAGIANGQEDQLRLNLAGVKKSSLNQEKMSALQRMAQQGKDVNMEDAHALLNWQPNPDPNTLFEQTYGRQLTHMVAQNEPQTTEEAMQQDAPKAHAMLDVTTDILANQESFKKIAQEAEEFSSAQMFQNPTLPILGTKGVENLAQSMLPLVSAINMRNVAANTASLLPGNNLDEQVSYLWSLPPEQASAEFKAAVSRLQLINPHDATVFAQAVMGYSDQERILNNSTAFADATILGGPLLKLGRLLRGAVKGNAPEKLNLGNTLAAIGDIEKSADTKAVENTKALLNPTVVPVVDRGYDPLGQKLDLTSTLPSWANPNSLAVGPNIGSLSRERASRITGKLLQQNELVANTMENIMRVSRTTDTELRAGLVEAKAALENDHLSILDSVLDVRTSGVEGFEHIQAEKTPTNVDYAALNLGKTKVQKLTNDLGFPLGPVEGEKKSAFLKKKEADFGEVVIGKPDATLFKSATEADNYAQRELGLEYNQYRTVQGPGTKWYISVVRPVDETSPTLRGMPLETRNTNPVNMSNYFLGYIRTPADQVAQFVRDNRLIATTAPSEIHRMIKKLAEPLIAIQKDTSDRNPWNRSWDRLQSVLSYYRDFEDHSLPNSRGMFPKSMSQLEKDWKKVTGRLPNDNEQLAFWTAVKINDFDWMLRNYNLHRDLARQGVEHVAFPHPVDKGTYTGPVWGKVLENDKFPWTNPEDSVLAIHKDGEWSYTTRHSPFMATEEGEKIKLWMKQPRTKITQIANPDDRPLKGVLDRNPHFVISEDIQRSNLPVKLVDYNGGGHVIYPGEWYAKQPVVEQGLQGKWYHYGDQTIMNFETRAQAERYIPRIEEFRQKLVRGDIDLDEFVQRNLPKDVKFWTDKFLGKNAILSLDHPIMMTRRNSTTFRTNPELKEMYRDKFGADVISYPESSYNLTAGMDKSFLQDRDGPLMSIKGTGSPNTPVYSLTKAKVLEPLMAMERGVYNAIKGLYMNDVKTTTVEQWIRQFKSLLSDPIEKVERNPYYQFYHGKLATPDGKNDYAIQAAENARRNLKNFLRTGSEFGDDINIIEEHIYDSLYKSGKPYGGFYETKGIVGDRTLNYVAAKDWNTIKHPVDFLRSSGSSLRYGWFNPIQLWVQAAGATNAVAVSPIHGMPGTAAAMLHYFHAMGEATLAEGVSKGVLEALDKTASTAGGWRKDTFSESINGMGRTGFWNVGRETSWRDSITDPLIFQGQHQQFIDKSYMFFNQGDRFNRLVSWHTAFHEWRWANPDVPITDRILGQIENRADLLGLNMTRESNSALQKGIMGPATQFQSFRMRLAEAMMSSRLTPMEKTRAFAAASMMFGVPIALSGYGLGKLLPGGVFDFYEDMHKYALDHDIDINSTWYTALHGGLMDLVSGKVFGTQHEFSKRYGPGASPSIASVDTEFPYLHLGEMFTQEGSGLGLLIGPPGSLVETMAKAALPFYAGIYTAVRAEQDQFAVTNDEILDVARQVSSINAAYNGFMAWNYQKYVSRNKQIVADDLSKTDAIMSAFLGTTRSDIGNARTMQAIGKNEKDKVDFFGKIAGEEYRKMYNALDAGEYYKADLYLANAKIYLKVFGDLNETEMLKVFHQSIAESGALVDRVNQKFYDVTKMPPSKMPARLRQHFGIILDNK